jgi:site-specific recombinase XerD
VSSPESRLEDAKAWILAHPVPNTEAAYSTYNKQFHALLKRQGAPSMPAEPASVVNFMEELVDRGLAVGTINSVALSAIAAEYKLVDFQSPTSSSLVRAAKLVVGRKATPPGPGKKPLTVDHILAIVDSSSEKLIDVRDSCLVTVTMAAFLRESEAADLLVTDCWLELVGLVEVLVILIVKSKVDGLRKGHTVVVGPATSHPHICPVKQFKRWKQVRRRDAAYLFHHAGSATKLSSKTPNGILKKLLGKIGVDPTEYGSHSCRKGGCTAAALAGIEVRVLKRHGNWKSDTVYTYIHESIEEKLSVSQAIF